MSVSQNYLVRPNENGSTELLLAQGQVMLALKAKRPGISKSSLFAAAKAGTAKPSRELCVQHVGLLPCQKQSKQVCSFSKQH